MSADVRSAVMLFFSETSQAGPCDSIGMFVCVCVSVSDGLQDAAGFASLTNWGKSWSCTPRSKRVEAELRENANRQHNPQHPRQAVVWGLIKGRGEKAMACVVRPLTVFKDGCCFRLQKGGGGRQKDSIESSGLQND